VTRAYLALGSNLGDRLSYLQGAVNALDAIGGIGVVAVSRVCETEPVGGPAQGAYYNAVVAIETSLDVHSLLRLAQRLEADAARVREAHWGPRSLDVDILLFGDATIDDPDLTVPHPRMWERGFVLAPLRDVAPALVDADASWQGVRVAPVALIS